MIYKGFEVTIVGNAGSYSADFTDLKFGDEFTTDTPRETKEEAVGDAKREINHILYGETEALRLKASEL